MCVRASRPGVVAKVFDVCHSKKKKIEPTNSSALHLVYQYRLEVQKGKEMWYNIW